MKPQIRDFKEPDFDSVVRLLENMDPWRSDRMTLEYYRSIFGANTGHNIKLAVSSTSDIIGAIAWQCLSCYPYGGYVRILAVADSQRRCGIGAMLLSIAEVDIFRSLKNSFVSVHESNNVARIFYQCRGYYEVGPLYDYIHKGQTMIMLRKTIGPAW